MYVRQHDYPAALDAYNEAMRDVHDDPTLYRAKGQVLETLGKVTEEIRLQSEALAQELHWTNLEMRAGSTREEGPSTPAPRAGLSASGS